MSSDPGYPRRQHILGDLTLGHPRITAPAHETPDGAVTCLERLALVPSTVEGTAIETMTAMFARENVAFDVEGYWIRGADDRLYELAARRRDEFLVRTLSLVAELEPARKVLDPMPEHFRSERHSGFVLDGLLAQQIQWAHAVLGVSHRRLDDQRVKDVARAFVRALVDARLADSLVLTTYTSWVQSIDGEFLDHTMLVLDARRDRLILLRLSDAF